MKFRRYILVAVAVILMVNAAIGYHAYCKDAKASDTTSVLENLDLMMQVMQLIRNNYVDAEQLSTNQLLEDAIAGMTSSLDPFSEYMPPADLKNLNEETQGEFGGVGMVVSMKNGFMTVVSTIDGTPAARAGILANDQIVSIDGADLTGVSSDKVLQLLRGEVGTKVTVGIKRPDVAEIITVELIRAMIPVKSVVDTHVIDQTTIGYVRVTEFMAPTPEDFQAALKTLLEKKITGLIIDLRNNPGGLLDSAGKMCSMFIAPGNLIVSVEGRNPENNYKVLSKSGFQFPANIPIVVLINGGSASASEIMASCMKDYQRATILGEKSFGKGSVQSVHTFPNGAGLKLTIAKYFTRSRVPIHGKGLVPNVVSKMTRDDYKAIYEAENVAARDAIDPNLKHAVKLLQTPAEAPKAAPAEADKAAK